MSLRQVHQRLAKQPQAKKPRTDQSSHSESAFDKLSMLSDNVESIAFTLKWHIGEEFKSMPSSLRYEGLSTQTFKQAFASAVNAFYQAIELTYSAFQFQQSGESVVVGHTEAVEKRKRDLREQYAVVFKCEVSGTLKNSTFHFNFSQLSELQEFIQAHSISIPANAQREAALHSLYDIQHTTVSQEEKEGRKVKKWADSYNGTLQFVYTADAPTATKTSTDPRPTRGPTCG